MAARNALIDRTVQVVVPTIGLAEITFLYARHRIAIDLPHVLAHMASAANCLVYPLDGAVVERLPTTLNIHDAIIVATALVFRDVLSESTAVVTKDADITASGLINVLW
jgi:predicted nucleic acid-binding protein